MRRRARVPCPPPLFLLWVELTPPRAVGGHELRACAAVCGLALSDPDAALFPPLMALVDFRGFRLLAVSHLPDVSERTLVYGSADHGDSVVDCDERFRAKISRLAERLNLAQHTCRGKAIALGADCEGHFNAATGRHFLLDLARMFPPEAPSDFVPKPAAATDGAPSLADAAEDRLLRLERDEENASLAEHSPAHLYRQLRPSLVQQSPAPLSSDAFSRFSEHEPDATMHNERVRAATAFLRGACVQRAAVFLAHRPGDAALYPRHFKLGHFLHERGVNVRLLGLVHARLPDASPWTDCVRCEMVARAFKSVLRRRWRAVGRSHARTRPSDEDFHVETVRQLNRLFAHPDAAPLSHMGVSFARRDASAPLSEPLRRWWARLAADVELKFGPAANGGNALARELCAPERLCEVLRGKRHALLERACQLLGLDLTAASPQLPSPDHPLAADALRPVQPAVKHLNLISLAEAKVLHLVALREAPGRACESLRRARDLLVESRQNQPFTTTAMLADIGLVSFELGIRLSPAQELQMREFALPNLMQAEGAFRDIIGRRQHARRDPEFLNKRADVELDRILERDGAIARTVLAKKWANVQLVDRLAGLRQARCLLLVDGDVVLAAGDCAVALRRASNAVLWRHAFAPGSVARCAAVCDAGVSVLLALPDRVLALCLADGKRTALELPLPAPLRNDVDDAVGNERVLGLGVLPGARVAFGAMRDGSLVAWDLERRAVLAHVADAHYGSVTGLAVHAPASALVTCASDGAVRVWRFHADSRTLSLARELVGHVDAALCVAVVEAGADDGLGEEEPSSPLTPASLRLRRGSIGAVVRSHSAAPLSPSSQQPPPPPPPPQQQQGRSGSGSWTMMAGLRDRRSRSRDGSREEPTSLRLRVASAGSSGAVFVFDADTGALTQRLEGHLDAVTSLVFASATTLFSASADRTIRLWSVSLGACLRVLTGHTDDVLCVQYDFARHALFSSAADGTVREWRFDRLTILGVQGLEGPAEELGSQRRSARSLGVSLRASAAAASAAQAMPVDASAPQPAWRRMLMWLGRCI